MARRLIAIISMAGLMVPALPALAGGTVYCGGGGHLYTTGEASTAAGQSHYRGINKAGPFLQTYKQVYWGFHSGSQSWDVKPDPATITFESAVCPT